MEEYLDIEYEQLVSDLLLVCEKHKLNPNGLGLTLSLGTDDYNKINPSHRTKSFPDMINKSSEKDGVIWNIKIVRRLDASELPSAMQPPQELNNTT